MQNAKKLVNNSVKMRWKLYGDVRENPYKCCWFMHVRTGTVLLGIYSLVNQIVGLFLASYILSHPDVVPQWLSSFEVSRFGTPQTDGSVCGHAGIRHKRDVGGMMDRMPVMNSSMMHGPMMHEHGPMMHGHMKHGHVKHGPMMHDEVIQDGSHSVEEKSADVDDGKVLPRVDDLMLPGQVMPDVGNMMPEADSVGVQLADVLSNPDNKISAKHDAAAASDADDDDRELIIPVGSQAHDTSPFHGSFPKYGSRVGLNADDKFFMYVMIICCIAASVLLIVGVIKGHPGHMIPYMGLQAFDFCASALFVFATFSYLPYLKTWILSLPNSFPHKCDLLAMRTDRLMLAIILVAVSSLVVKAYLMGVVWSCYKYLTQAGEAGGRRRSMESDAAHSPEDAELLLPPKYEEIGNLPSVAVEAPPPPAYTTH